MFYWILLCCVFFYNFLWRSSPRLCDGDFWAENYRRWFQTGVRCDHRGWLRFGRKNGEHESGFFWQGRDRGAFGQAIESGWAEQATSGDLRIEWEAQRCGLGDHIHTVHNDDVSACRRQYESGPYITHPGDRRAEAKIGSFRCRVVSRLQRRTRNVQHCRTSSAISYGGCGSERFAVSSELVWVGLAARRFQHQRQIGPAVVQIYSSGFDWSCGCLGSGSCSFGSCGPDQRRVLGGCRQQQVEFSFAGFLSRSGVSKQESRWFHIGTCGGSGSGFGRNTTIERVGGAHEMLCHVIGNHLALQIGRAWGASIVQLCGQHPGDPGGCSECGALSACIGPCQDQEEHIVGANRRWVQSGDSPNPMRSWLKWCIFFFQIHLLAGTKLEISNGPSSSRWLHICIRGAHGQSRWRVDGGRCFASSTRTGWQSQGKLRIIATLCWKHCWWQGQAWCQLDPWKLQEMSKAVPFSHWDIVWLKFWSVIAVLCETLVM